MRRPIAVAITIAAILVAGGAAAGYRLSSAAASEGVRPAAAPSSARPDVPPNEADLMFATMMVPHHAQAVELSELLLDASGIDHVSVALAEFIKKDQTQEIAQMQAWLDAWHRAGAGDHHGAMDMAPGAMAGMAMPDQLERLDAAEGREAERQFLALMIAHHEGALVMTRDVLAEGENEFIRALAKHIAAEQEREIAAMTVRLAGL